MDNFKNDDYKPTYTYFGTLTLQGFPTAELYTYYSEFGELRIDVRGSYYPFDVPGEHTLATSLHFIACNLYRCEFAARGSGQIYDESRMPRGTLEITAFHYFVRRRQFAEPEHVNAGEEDREACKNKTWEDLTAAEGMLEVDIVYGYV